jgi:hypothetical protein
MPCNASYTRFIFGKFFICTIIWYALLCGQNFILVKSGCYSSQDGRAMPIIREGSWILKLEILCTSRCHLWEVCASSRYEESSHLCSVDYSILHRREVEWPINWSCHRSCLMCTTCFMSLNWRSVCVCLKSKYLCKIWMLVKISPIKSTLSRS